VAAGARVAIDARGKRRWAPARKVRIGPQRRFRVRVRLRGRRLARLALAGARLSPHVWTLRLRARLPGVGRSAIVRVRVRRRAG
jgi:hypothetical protein